MYVDARRESGALTVAPRGEWHCAAVAAIATELDAITLSPGEALQIDCGAAHFDLSGAWLLHDFRARAMAAGHEVRLTGPPPPPLELVDRTLAEGGRAEGPTIHASLLHADAAFVPVFTVAGLGQRTIQALRHVVASLAFVGQVTLALPRMSRHLRTLRPVAVARHVYDTGVTAIPIVGLIAFLIAVILAYIGAQQLRNFGATIFVVDLVTIGVLRELGVLLTAIMVAGRSGSAFAAEIGAMRLNEEVDALDATGVDPIEALVVPRLLGLVIALPLLTVVADIIGLAGGALLCHSLLGMPLAQYMNRAQGAIASTTFWVGLIKAPVFAVLIAVSGTWCGMQVRDSSRELGRLTTLAVVLSIFFVILADALFAVLFLEIDV